MSTTDVAQRDPVQNAIARIRSDEFKQQLASALPENVSADRFARVTATALLDDAARQKDPSKRLTNADPASLYQAVIKCAQDGLMPDGREAALVKRGDQVAYMPMVKGLVRIAGEHGWMITARVVCANDEFEHVEEPPSLKHVPVRPGADRGNFIAAYAVARHKDGRRMQRVLYPDEVAKRRRMATTDQVWANWTEQQWEKTAARDIVADLPFDAADRERVDRVIAADLAPGEAATLLYGATARELPPAPGPGSNGSQGGAADTAQGDQPAGADGAAATAPGNDFAGDTDVADTDVQAAQDAAGYVVTVPKADNWANGLTLAQIKARGEEGLLFFRWALTASGRGANKDEALRAAAAAYAKVQLPFLHDELVGGV